MLWRTIFEDLSKNLNYDTIETWLRPVKPVKLEADCLKLEVPNKLFNDWLNQNYKKAIEEKAGNLLSKPITVSFVVCESDAAAKGAQSQSTSRKAKNTSRAPFTRKKLFAKEINLNPKYTFDTFVVGPSNRFAHAASMAVAQSPAKAYNPLFIYGGVGLGKTHLMQAAGHYVLDKHNDANVIYISSEKFTNQLIDAIQNRTTIKFRNKYRNVDILLIDDVHFLGGKEQTQEEFFHTFNTLYDAHKQIVLSSDRPPKEIPNLEDRLVSRFEWGLVTDLQPPDVETRMAIIRKKAQDEGINISNEILFHVASKIKSNVRKLEGALSRLSAYSSLMNTELNLDIADAILADIISTEELKQITIEDVQKKVAEFFDIRVSDMMSKKRPHSIAYPRQIAMYLARKIIGSSLPEIGDAFGGRDHTTVLHASRAIEKRLAGDKNLEKIIASLEKHLRE
jgi:chromosomal replication initiator protein